MCLGCAQGIAAGDEGWWSNMNYMSHPGQLLIAEIGDRYDRGKLPDQWLDCYIWAMTNPFFYHNKLSKIPRIL